MVASNIVTLALCLGALVALVNADAYMQTISGSNNRLDERNRDRNNANRIFDSQNNNRGGVNVQSKYYYEGETISMTWTNQHGCGQSGNDCQLVVQYMCDSRLRDGVTTRTIPDQPNNCLYYDCNNDVRYGMHEDYDYYMNCRYRHRNKGLFTADRRLNGQTARFTRQNNNGARRGYECPEERDHYPYWHPTPWIDVAMLTTRPEMCDMYKTESENVKGRNYCAIPDTWYHHMIRRGGNGNNGFIPNNEGDCLNLNNPGTGMVNFLRESKESEYKKLHKRTENELQKCQEFVADFDSLLFTDYGMDVEKMCSEKTINVTNLEAQCPQCGAGFIPHPRPPTTDGEEPCFVCIPDTCSSAFTEKAADGCATGYAEDLFNPNVCVTDACFNTTNTHDEQLLVDQCRMQVLAEKHLVNNCMSDTTRTCMQREIMTADCFASNIAQAAWRRAPSHSEKDASVPELQCSQAAWSRWNHLGNGVNMAGENNGFNFTWPAVKDESVRCTMRLRYNITTADYGPLDPHNSSQVNSALNKRANNQPAKIPINEWYGIETSNSQFPYENKRGYLFEQNPVVQPFDLLEYQFKSCPEGLAIEGDKTRCYTNAGKTATRLANENMNYWCMKGETMKAGTTSCFNAAGAQTMDAMTEEPNGYEIKLRLAINTNQFGRTFQDRSHSFYVKKRTAELKHCSTIYSLTVRGKRGNIVQTFPSTEYDFYPRDFHISQGDCVHIQWSGSNTNPNNNDGQGKQGTDRHNLMVMEDIRGEGGRGAERYGGHGADGTTWTTKAQEPGLEGYIWEESTTMVDYPCPIDKIPHPRNFKKCAHNSCEWRMRDTYKTIGEDGETLEELKACMGNWRVDSEDDHYCVSASCPAFERRPMSSDFWSTEVREKMMRVGVMDGLKHGYFGSSHPRDLHNVSKAGFLGLDYEALNELAFHYKFGIGGETSELDDLGVYFDYPVFKVTVAAATYHTMCTRNNNFSNRSQKGRIVVSKAPEKTKGIGANGGVIDITVREAFNAVPKNDEQRIQDADYSVVFAKKSLPNRVDVSTKVFSSSGGVDFRTAASSVFYMGPASIASVASLPAFTFTEMTMSRKRDASLVDVKGELAVYNASTIAYKIWGDNFNNATCPSVKVQFKHEETETDVIVPETFNNRGHVAGLWTAMTQEQMRATERGEMWVSLWCGDAEYSQKADKDPESGRAFNVTMPISYTASHGKVYFYPDTEAGRTCMMSSTADRTGCGVLRKTVNEAWFSRDEVKFAVGGSVTQPAGGYYVVSSGSNLAVVVGVTVSCIMLSLVAVGSAVYFRRHPDKWEELKGYGPSKMKSIQRSMASHV